MMLAFGNLHLTDRQIPAPELAERTSCTNRIPGESNYKGSFTREVKNILTSPGALAVVAARAD